MGFFSWKTSDTEHSIPSVLQLARTPFTVHMITEDGQVFTEDQYEGYGVFGGKDIYTLIGELNGATGTEDEKRLFSFDVLWERGIRKVDGSKKLVFRTDYDNYETPIPSEGGKTANQLARTDEWENYGDSGEFDEWSRLGFKVPKLVEELKANPKNRKEWNRYWNSLPYPVSCEFQGFFYETDDNGDPLFDEDDDDNFIDPAGGRGLHSHE